MAAKKLPAFGDRKAIEKLRSGSSELVKDEERKLHGKIFTVCVSYTVTSEHTKTFDVIALDGDDAEEVACRKVEEEEGADDDSVEPQVISVREPGKREEKTLEMFPNHVPECGKS
jgi:hypothetical protein